MNLTDVLIDLLLFVFVIDCALLCLIVLMQRSKQEGLGAAFGGSLTSEILGTGTSAFLVRATVVLAAIFFLTSIALARLYSAKASVLETHPATSVMDQALSQPLPIPDGTNAAPAVPAPTPSTPK